MGLVVGIVSFIVFVFFQAIGIFTGDSGDVVTAAIGHGVPHPPGYPLYTLVGYLLSRLSLFTPSWRVTLLSSIPHAFTVALVFILVFRLTKNRVASVFAALTLMSNYLFFLYSVTPEVFALFDFFVILLFYEGVVYRSTRSLRTFYLLIFTFGLSLTHHQVILFMVPALGYLLWRVGLPKKFGYRDGMLLIGIFVLGLLPYLYLPFAGASNAIINWDKPTTFSRFVQLISRQDYGSFVSGGIFGHSLLERLVSIKAYMSFVFLDFTVIGIFMILMGLWALWRKDRLIAQFILIALGILGPFFFFYASFPIVSRFTLGTYERFLLSSYSIYAVLLGVGFNALHQYVSLVLKKRWSAKAATVGLLCAHVLFLYPLLLLSITVYRFVGLRTDHTAENLGRDVLSSVPEQAILLLSQDTTLFTTQYVRYGLNVRPDTIVIHASRITAVDYQEVLKEKFPMLMFPQSSSPHYLRNFIALNKKDHRIFSNTIVGVGSGSYFIPHGLVYEIVSTDGLLPIDELIKQNTLLFASYTDPTSGILSRYKHLMLSDVLDVYAWAHVNYGKTLVKAMRYREAKKQFQDAVSLGGDSSVVDAYTYIGATYAILRQCDDALEALKRAKIASFVVKPEQVLYESLTYRDCVKDATTAASLYSSYENLKGKTEPLLQSL